MQTELNELLTKAKELLKDETTKISYETWIKNLEIQSADNGNIILLATSTFQKDAIEARYHDLLQNTFKYITNKERCPVCGNPTSDNWSGLLIITKPEESELANELNIDLAGEYCLRVR